MILVGLDEVGRGCWAGPLVAGAVVLRKPIPGLKDSKMLSAVKRAELAGQIQETSDFGLGWVSAAEIDAIGLTRAVALAMERAIVTILSPYDDIVIDGNYNFLPSYPMARTMVKADAHIPAVSAASILAKVARDTYMAQLDPVRFPYAFEKHVGYGTALHRSLLKQWGVSGEHRKSFKPVREILNSVEPTGTAILKG